MATTSTRFFEPIDIDSAPEESKETLRAVQKKFGFIPNLIGTLAHAPAALKSYVQLDAIFAEGSFSPKERQIVALAASVENDCKYCVAAHGTALKQLKLEDETLQAIKEGRSIGDSKLQALVNLVREVVKQRGHVGDSAVQEFLQSGYSQPQLMEVLVGVAMKTLTNYVDHLNPVDIDPAFAS